MWSAGKGDRAGRRWRCRRWMDVLERLNGMLIKGLVCCLRHKAHRQIHNVPLETSVISAEARQPCRPPPPAQSLNCNMVGLVWTLKCGQMEGVQLQRSCSCSVHSYLLSLYNGSRQNKAKTQGHEQNHVVILDFACCIVPPSDPCPLNACVHILMLVETDRGKWY